MSGEISPSDTFYKSDEEIILSLEKVGMCFSGKQNVHALSDFSLNVHKGEFICILGPSGCGKSTLLSIIAGIYPATEGSVQIEGKPIAGMDWHRAIMFQTSTLYPWLSVYDNIAFGPKVRKVPKKQIDDSVRKYIELVGLKDFTYAKPYELSGGMKQRASLARVLVNEPSVILMDEPLCSLDAFTRSLMQVFIRDIWRKIKMTTLLITHDIDEALSLGSRVIVLSKRPGRIIGMFNAMFSRSLMGTPEDDELRASGEYVSMRRKIYDLIDTSTDTGVSNTSACEAQSAVA